jgi:UDP-N-acetylmuramate--alanine ligase
VALPPPGSTIHLIGIGGTGMSAIARVLLGQGYRVTGSDRMASALASALVVEGAAVMIGHDAAHVGVADAVITTSAAADDHVEIAAARARRIPVFRRADVLGDLTRGKRVIAIAGTAGKTTTTAMIAHMLVTLGHDPSYVLGGTLPTTGKNGHAGRGNLFVIEADEYDHMFLGLSPHVAVITNIVWDHPDFFPTVESKVRAFEMFSERILPRGTMLAYSGDARAMKLLSHFAQRSGVTVLSYGTHDKDSIGISQVSFSDGLPSFTLMLDGGYARVPVRLSVPGMHNVLNAAAAIGAIRAAGGDSPAPHRLADALTRFTGADRRFQVMGERAGVVVVDDYAHHPLKISAALQAARSRYPSRAIWAVWQPHTFTRTQALWDDFTTCFADADHVLVTPIYAARESAISGVDGAAIAEAIAARHADARHVESFDAALTTLQREVRAPAVIIILSAGDAPRIGRVYLGEGT